MNENFSFSALVLSYTAASTMVQAKSVGKEEIDKAGQLKMEYKQFRNRYVIRMDNDAEITGVLKTFCKEKNITLGTISGLGSLKSATLGFFDPKTKEYKEKTFNEPLEMASLVGNIAVNDGEPLLHLHTTIAGKDYKAYAGHMAKATVSLTAEIYIDVIKGKVEKTFDPETGLNRLNFRKK